MAAPLTSPHYRNIACYHCGTSYGEFHVRCPKCGCRTHGNPGMCKEPGCSESTHCIVGNAYLMHATVCKKHWDANEAAFAADQKTA